MQPALCSAQAFEPATESGLGLDAVDLILIRRLGRARRRVGHHGHERLCRFCRLLHAGGAKSNSNFLAGMMKLEERSPNPLSLREKDE